MKSLWILEHSAADTAYLKKAVGCYYEVSNFSRFGELRKALQSGRKPKLLLSELYLPDGNIMEFMETNGSSLPPILVISRSNSFHDISACLELGAQDYLLKPVDRFLLRAKVGQFIKTEPHPMTQLRLDPFSMQLTVGKKKISLTVKEFQILSLIHRAYPYHIDRTTIHREIWKEVKVISKAFDVHLFKLRRKIEPLGLEIHFTDKTKYFLSQKQNSTRPRSLPLDDDELSNHY